MSLINQMLQDLDARNSDGVGASVVHAQVRAVPERHGIHAAWWVVLVLAILLGAAVAWLWLYGIVPAAQPPLALKLAQGMSAVPVAVSPKPVGEKKDVVEPVAPPIPAPAMQTAPKVIPDKLQSALMANAAPSAVAASTTSNALSAAAAVSLKNAVSETSTLAKKRGQEAPSEAAEASSPAGIRKQVKELTQQQRAENEYRKATSLMQQGRTTETIVALEHALELDSLHAAARQTLIGLLLESRRQDEALSKAQEGLRLDPGQAGMAMILAHLQVEKDELSSAVETLQRTLPYTQDRADYHAFLAALLQRQARHKDAIEHYLAAVRKAPQNGVWWMGLGISLQAENRSGEAQEAYGRAKASNTLAPELQGFVEQKLNQMQR